MERRHFLLGFAGATAAAGIVSTGTASAQTAASEPERKHAQDTVMAGAASLMMADIALEKATKPEVKQFAKFEHDEQTTIAEILKSMDPTLAQAKPDPATTEAITKLRGMSAGAEFDRAFVAGQIEGHQKLLAIQEAYLKAGRNREAVNVTKLAAGMIKEHLALLDRLKTMAG